MKEIPKKVQKAYALTIHVTATENRYLRTRKRETGLPISDVIREEYLSDAAESFFEQRKKNSRNGQPESTPTLQ